MRVIKSILTLTLLICILSQIKSEITEDENVLVLTKDNFDEAITSNKYVLVEFYAPWCGHCKSLAPEYAKAASALKAKNSEIKLAKVDATEQRELGERYEVQGFPTLKFFISGSDVEYSGGRTAEEILKWVEKKSGPSVSLINTENDLTKAIEDNQIVAVYFGSNEGDIYKEFNEVATFNESVPFLVANESLASSHGAQKDDIVVFKKFDNKKDIFDSTKERTAENISDFIESSSVPLVGPFDIKAAEYIFGKAKSAVFLYRDEAKTPEFDEVLKALAPEYKGRILFIATNITGELEEKLAEYIGVTQADLPSLRIHDVKENDVFKYSFKGEITVENARNFIEQFLNGKLTPEYKSEEIPEQDPNSKVIKVVGKNFDEIVKNPEKDVLVKYYAPWCGHCQALAPKWENLAQKFNGRGSVIIAKLDATANDVQGETIEGYPTLRFYSHKNKEGKDVSDLRNEYDVLEFLKQQELKSPIPEDITFEKPVEENPEDETEGEEVHDHDHDHHEHEHEGEDLGEIENVPEQNGDL